jgi:hypothetical protein
MIHKHLLDLGRRSVLAFGHYEEGENSTWDTKADKEPGSPDAPHLEHEGKSKVDQNSETVRVSGSTRCEDLLTGCRTLDPIHNLWP